MSISDYGHQCHKWLIRIIKSKFRLLLNWRGLLVATWTEFEAFSKAGKKLADLYINYEKVEPYMMVQIHTSKENPSYEVTKMRWGKVPGKLGNASKDKTKLFYNQDITITNIPLEAQEYVVNKRSALD